MRPASEVSEGHSSGDDGELATWGRRAFAALEAVHVPGYFSPECREEYQAIGLHPGLAYFPVRAAAMGAVPAEVVEATFYVFSPRLVRRVLPGCWQVAAPEQVLTARHTGVARTLHRLLDPVVEQSDPGALDEAVTLARQACEALAAPGRPLYAGHASLPWPEDPLLQLWHASTLVREHRGDGHVAQLVGAGLGPIEAMLTAVLAGQTVSLAFLRRSRGWADAEWDDAARLLRERGLLTQAADPGAAADGGLTLTAEGARLRQAVESGTDRAALAGWAHLGLDGTRRLATLLRPLSTAIMQSDALAPLTSSS